MLLLFKLAVGGVLTDGSRHAGRQGFKHLVLRIVGRSTNSQGTKQAAAGSDAEVSQRTPARYRIERGAECPGGCEASAEASRPAQRWQNAALCRVRCCGDRAGAKDARTSGTRLLRLLARHRQLAVEVCPRKPGHRFEIVSWGAKVRA